MTKPCYLLTLACANQPGIVATVTTALFQCGGNILEAQQFDDPETSRFFIRMVFDFAATGSQAEAFRAAFAPIGDRFGMLWRLRPTGERSRVLILVSRPDHCLVDLLYRQRTGELNMDVAAIVSNHPRETFAAIDMGAVPFHHLPITPNTKATQEGQIRALIEVARVDLVVLARYMQILSTDMARHLSGRCINIHHSFLPGFKGAQPYHQAHTRGVKLIGATAHYVTADLDEGPIIEQDVERISHNDSPADLIRKGRDIERRVLARAVSFHIDGRAFMNGQKAIVFRD